MARRRGMSGRSNVGSLRFRWRGISAPPALPACRSEACCHQYRQIECITLDARNWLRLWLFDQVKDQILAFETLRDATSRAPPPAPLRRAIHLSPRTARRYPARDASDTQEIDLSKLADKIRSAARSEPQPLGFGSAKARVVATTV